MFRNLYASPKSATLSLGTLDLLPDEIIVTILNLLENDNKSRAKFSRACRKAYDLIQTHFVKSAYGEIAKLANQVVRDAEKLEKAITQYQASQTPSVFNWRLFSALETHHLGRFLIFTPFLLLGICKNLKLDYRDFYNPKLILIICFFLCILDSVRRARANMPPMIINQHASAQLTALLNLHPFIPRQLASLLGSNYHPILSYDLVTLSLSLITVTLQSTIDEITSYKNSVRGRNIQTIDYTFFHSQDTQEVLGYYRERTQQPRAVAEPGPR